MTHGMYTTNSRFPTPSSSQWFRFDRTFAILIQVVLHKDTVLAAWRPWIEEKTAERCGFNGIYYCQ